MVRKCSYTLESEMTGEEVNEILRCIGKYKPNGIHIEIGTAAGGTMCSILKYYKFVLNFNQPTFIAVDPLSYFENQYEVICRNLKKNQLTLDNVVFEKKTSNQAFKSLKIKEIAFLLIDGNHKLKNVVKDLRFARLLKRNGLLVVHDYSTSFPGVKIALDIFIRRCTNYEVISNVNTLLVLRKKSSTNVKEIKTLDIFLAYIFSFLLQNYASIKKRI